MWKAAAEQPCAHGVLGQTSPTLDWMELGRTLFRAGPDLRSPPHWYRAGLHPPVIRIT